MANCKQCGQTIVWPQPYKAGQRPFASDGVTLHDCPAFGKTKQTQVQEEVNEAQKLVDEEARKREQAAQLGTTKSTTKDESIREMFDIKQDLSKEFLAEKRRYNDLYERFILCYEKEIQMKMTEEMRRHET
jgi:hypothetical protein